MLVQICFPCQTFTFFGKTKIFFRSKNGIYIEFFGQYTAVAENFDHFLVKNRKFRQKS